MIRFWTAAFFVLSCLTVWAVELVSGPHIRQFEHGATLEWRTEVACGTRASFGTSPNTLHHKAEGPVSEDHRVTLTGLEKGKTYFYEIGSARQKLATGHFVFGESKLDPAAQPVEPARAPKSILERLVEAMKPETAQPQMPAKTSTAARAPPTRMTWGRLETLQDHFDRHGADFQSRDPDDYAAQAWRFLQRAKSGELPMKWDEADDSLRVYDPQTRAFAAYNRDGTTKTFFRPNSPTYWQRQPGRLIRPSELPFKP